MLLLDEGARFRAKIGAFRRESLVVATREAADALEHFLRYLREHCGANIGGRAYLGSTNWSTVFEVPPSGGGLKTCTATARYPIVPTFWAGPGAL